MNTFFVLHTTRLQLICFYVSRRDSWIWSQNGN